MIRTAINQNLTPDSVSKLAPALFRIGFGLVMFGSTVRFMMKGWVTEFYIQPTFHFSFFEWIKPWPAYGMWIHFTLMAFAAFCIATGWFYRIATVAFFLLFTYVELLDKTYYLNHYYAISLVAFLLCFLPLHYALSIDACRNPSIRKKGVSKEVIWAVQLQLAIIYVGAGIAKWNMDWLIHAQPMTMWMKANYALPLIGPWLGIWPIPHLLSWAGMLYDCCIPLLLLYPTTRVWAYGAVVAFHVLTALFFHIGVFPWVMIAGSIIFLAKPCGEKKYPITTVVLMCFFVLQLLGVVRHWAYPGNFFWTEEGFRFSWNVMIIEKAGMLELQAYDPKTKSRWDIFNGDYLNSVQERQMVTQPDMILQFAHYIGHEFKKQGYAEIQVLAKTSYVSLNGRPSQAYIRNDVDLLGITKPKDALVTLTP